MTLVDVDDFLAHYGVKGMRWGVRKKEDRVTKAPKRTAHRTKLEAKYLTKGQTREQAQASAEKRIKAEKVVLAAAGVAVVAADDYAEVYAAVEKTPQGFYRVNEAKLRKD